MAWYWIVAIAWASFIFGFLVSSFLYASSKFDADVNSIGNHE